MWRESCHKAVIDLRHRPPSLTAVVDLVLRTRYAVEAVGDATSKEMQMVEELLLVIQIRESRSHISSLWPRPEVLRHTDRLLLLERRYDRRCRKRNVATRSLITSPPSGPRLPHLSTPSNVWSTSSRRLSVQPRGSQTVSGTCILFEKQ